MDVLDKTLEAFELKDIRTALVLWQTISAIGISMEEVNNRLQNMDYFRFRRSRERFVHYIAEHPISYKNASWYIALSKKERNEFRQSVMAHLDRIKGKRGKT